MSGDCLIREAKAADIPEILRQRQAMYEDMGHKDPAALSTMLATSQQFLLKALPEGMFRGWIAESANAILGGGAVLISPWPSHTYDGECRRATILNVYTYPQYRRRGVATRLMNTMISWCRQEGFARVYLHASEDGRPLYEALGFEPTTEMRLKLR